MNLSPNFTLAEFTLSETASRRNIPNHPSELTITSLKRLAISLEEIRLLLGVPIQITSGYRSMQLNSVIGGSPRSMHCQGLAADFIAPPLAVLDICQRIAKSAIKFDQLIYEYDWVHFGLGTNILGQRQQVLTKRGSSYVEGLTREA